MNQDQWRQRCEQELGKPYIWGAEGPEAYDCSGFAQFALGLVNLDPAGDQTANGLYRYFSAAGRSQPVGNIDDARLGDLVYFGTDEGVIHIALAWGDGRMLEAGGGGHKTTSVAIAREQHAEVRIRSIGQRRDLVAILRPRDLPWAAAAVEAMAEAMVESAGGFGHYTGLPPLTEWLSDGRHMQLKRPFGYVDAGDREWPVPSETIVDGASIPRVFWSLIGGPLEGLYRNASIVHDHHCVVRANPWRDVHRMFYEAMLCSGVPGIKARVMFYAVYRFGPRWETSPAVEVAGFAQVKAMSVPTALPSEAFDAASFMADAAYIQEQALDPTAIERLADARAAARPAAKVLP